LTGVHLRDGLLAGNPCCTWAWESCICCHSRNSSLDQVANRKSIAERAQILIAYIRTHFSTRARNGSIILTRTQITDSYAHNASRHSDSPVSYIYEQLIPWLASCCVWRASIRCAYQMAGIPQPPKSAESLQPGRASQSVETAEQLVSRLGHTSQARVMRWFERPEPMLPAWRSLPPPAEADDGSWVGC
jgi:hypothetical protein